MIAPALLVVLTLVAPAAPKKVVVLVKSAGVPAAWRDELRAAAESAELKNGSFVPPPAVPLDDAATALGCPSFNETCAGQIAGMTGATHANVIDVAGGPSGVDITVRLVTDDGKLAGGTKKLHVGGTGADDLETAKALVRAAAADKPISMLWIETERPGATLSVDGEEVGKTPLPKAIVLDPGPHTVLLSQEGRAPLTVAVTLKPYETFRETYVLGSARPDPTLEPTIGKKDPELLEPDPVEPAPAAENAGMVPVIGYTAAGIGGVIALVGLGLTTAWVSGYMEAASNVEENKPLSRCLGLCSDETGFGLGISGGARQAYPDGSASAWIGASIATLGVGALLGATGLWLALSARPDEDGEPATP